MSKFIRCGIAAALAACTLAAAAEPYKIGGIFSFSGPFGNYGQNSRRGIEIAIEERGGKVAGRPIEVIWEDSETKPQVAVQKASRMIASGIDTLVGGVGSAETIAMMPLAAQAKIPHIVTLAPDDRITGANRTRYTFRTTHTFGMDNALIANHIKTAGLKKVYGVAIDIGSSRDSWNTIRDSLTKAGVAIAGVDFPPLGTTDMSVIVDKALRSEADAVVLVSAGNDAIAFLKQAHDVGLTKKAQILSPVPIDDLVKALGPAADGVQAVLRYHSSLDTPANKKFVDAYRKKFGELPDMAAGESYDGMAWWLDNVEKTGGTDREKWIDAFATSVRAASVKGPVRMRACDHQAEQGSLLGKGAKSGNDYAMVVTRVLPSEGLLAPCK